MLHRLAVVIILLIPHMNGQCSDGYYGPPNCKKCKKICIKNAQCDKYTGDCVGKPGKLIITDAQITASSKSNTSSSIESVKEDWGDCYKTKPNPGEWMQIRFKKMQSIKWLSVRTAPCTGDTSCMSKPIYLSVFVSNETLTQSNKYTFRILKEIAEPCVETTGNRTLGPHDIPLKCKEYVTGRSLIIFTKSTMGVQLCYIKIRACLEFTYGPTCRSICGHCYRNKSCHPIDGKCPDGEKHVCQKGFKGAGCSSPCIQGSYGYDCENQCECPKIKELCSKIDGRCNTSCSKGFQQFPACVIPCPSRTYGHGCMKTCSECLKKTEVCHHVNGSCSQCPKGKQPPKCDKDCLGKYGNNCASECHCKDNRGCDPLNGVCKSSGCAPGYMNDEKGPANCNTETCELVGHYGVNCTQVCKCKRQTPCPKSSGRCQFGCAKYYSGETCNLYIAGEYGWSVGSKIALGLGVACTIIIGCIVMLIMNKRHVRRLESMTNVVSHYADAIKKKKRTKSRQSLKGTTENPLTETEFERGVSKSNSPTYVGESKVVEKSRKKKRRKKTHSGVRKIPNDINDPANDPKWDPPEMPYFELAEVAPVIDEEKIEDDEASS